MESPIRLGESNDSPGFFDGIFVMAFSEAGCVSHTGIFNYPEDEGMEGIACPFAERKGTLPHASTTWRAGWA